MSISICTSEHGFMKTCLLVTAIYFTDSSQTESSYSRPGTAALRPNSGYRPGTALRPNTGFRPLTASKRPATIGGARPSTSAGGRPGSSSERPSTEGGKYTLPLTLCMLGNFACYFVICLSFLTLYSIGYFKIMTSFSIFRQH